MTLTPTVFYRDPIAALKWLEQVFGFETSMLVTDDAGRVGHAEMKIGDAVFDVGAEFASPELLGPAELKSPASLGGVGTQFIRIHMPDGLDAHFERARAAGARITPPTNSTARAPTGPSTWRAMCGISISRSPTSPSPRWRRPAA